MDLDYFVEECRRIDGTDIHFFPEKDGVMVRGRTPEGLMDMTSLDKEVYQVILQKLKIKGGLNISEKRLPQDGIIRIGEEEVRISTLRTLHGEAVTLRIFRGKALTLSTLGFEERDYEGLLSLIKSTFSLILITGETGSGKSTTMKSILKELASSGSKIISIEDPVEISVPGVMEVNLQEDIGLDYERAVFAALRQDPDYISIGEIRDRKSCDSCLKAALSGHSVISTFHSGGYDRTVMRLKSMTSYPESVESVLTLVINQRLVNEGGRRRLIATFEGGSLGKG